MNYSNLRSQILAAIKYPPKITAQALQEQLINIVNGLDLGALLLGVATPLSTPDTQANGFYFGLQPGTYTNFPTINGETITVDSSEVAIIVRSGNYWSKIHITTYPTIDPTTKHWMIGEEDTGVIAEGVTPHIDPETGNWMIGTYDTGVHAQGAPGKDAYQPFKGTFASVQDLNAAYPEPNDGDTAYVEDTVENTTVLKVFDVVNGEWHDTGTTADSPMFGSGQFLSSVKIDDTHLANPAEGSLPKAEDVMQLKAKLEGATAKEIKPEITLVHNRAVSGVDGHIVGITNDNGQLYRITIPEGTKSIRMLGWQYPEAKNYGWCLGYQENVAEDLLTDWHQLKWAKYSTGASDFTPKEYVIDEIPEGANTLLWTRGVTTDTAIPMLDSTYCYCRVGDTVIDLFPTLEVVDSLDSDSSDKALSAKQGKKLDEEKQNKTILSAPYYENVEHSSVQNAYISTIRLAPSDSFRTSLFPVEVGKTYRITGKFGSGSGSMLYAYMNGDNFIESKISASGREGIVHTTEITIPDGLDITHVAVEWSGTSPNATCEEKKRDEVFLEEVITELIGSQEEADEYIEEEREGKEINILCLGNSFTEDTMSYVPYLLVESGIKGYTFNIYMAYISGASLADYKEYVEGGTPASEKNPKLHVSTNGSPWVSQSLPSFLELIAMKNWDLVTIQQGGSINYTSYDTNYKTYINAICQQIQRRANTGVKIGYIMSHASYVNTTDTLSFDTETTRLQERFEGTDEYPGIAANARRVMEETPVSVLLPYATAVQNLRTASYLNELGAKGHLSHDHIHLTDGLPCLVAAYTNALAIMSYCMGEKTILSNPINPTRNFLNEKNVPSSTNGPVGLTAYNRRVAQTCAMLAIKKPYEISNIKEIGLIGDYKVTYSGEYSNYDWDNPIQSANANEVWTCKLTAKDGYSIQSVEVTMGGSVVSGTYDATTGLVYISNVTGDIVITPTLTQI